MADQPANATPVSVTDLPPLLTRSQASAVLQCSVSKIDRLLRHEEENLWPVRLGHGSKAPVRISRDELLSYAGLLTRAERPRRDHRKAETEFHGLTAKLGVAGEADGRSDGGVRA